MFSRKKLNTTEKATILALKTENISNSEIARRVGCTEGSVRYLIKKVQETGSSERKEGSGRQKILSTREERVLKRLSLRNRFATAPELKAELEGECSTSASVRTIQRRLNDIGLMARRPAKKPFLTLAMRKKRLLWAKERQNWTSDKWKKVVFSDESKFNLFGSDAQSPVRRRKGEKYNEDCIQPTVRYSGSVMVWGCITSRGVGHILFVEGSVNAAKFKNIIDIGLVPSLEELMAYIPDPIFQDDSAPCHRARSITIHKEDLGISSLPWPGNSPDLNPIENIWSLMAREMQKKRPKTIQQLKNLLEKVWYEGIREDTIKNLYESMPRRIKAVIKAKGKLTKY